MSRFKAGEVAREGAQHHDRNRELGQSLAIKRCERSDKTAGVALLAQRFMIVVSADEAIEIADGLVDAVEAISSTR